MENKSRGKPIQKKPTLLLLNDQERKKEGGRSRYAGRKITALKKAILDSCLARLKEKEKRKMVQNWVSKEGGSNSFR